MPRFERLIVLVAVMFSPAHYALGAKQDEVDRVISAGREQNLVMEHLDRLCNRIGARLTGSDGLQNANEWTRDRFASFGITNARLERWGEVAVGFNRGPWSGRVVEPREGSLQFVTPAWTAGTRGVVRGKAILSPMNEEELAKLRPKLKGSWVVTPLPVKDGPRPAPGFLKTLGEIFDKAEIAGVIRPAKGELVITDGNSRITWEKVPTTPSIRLLQKQFEEVVGWLKEGKDVTLEFDIRNHFKKGPIPQFNVVADIPGTDKADEFVIVGGHLDSWDGATGATDNGTGVATTLEAARILMKAGVKPRRTIRFMLWSGEEQGMLGSRAYVKAHPELLPKVSAVLVHDGGTNYLSGMDATEAMMSDFQAAFADVINLDSKFPFAINKVSGIKSVGSDSDSFLSRDVPGLFWSQDGTAKYSRTHHTQFDTFDAAVPDYQKHSALVVALGAYGIANLDNMISREKLRAPGMPRGRRLGVQLEEMTVTEVVEDGVAESAGMLPGDVIVKVDGAAVADRGEMVAGVQKGDPKKKFTVIRDGKEVELTLDWTPRETEKP